MLAGPFGPYQYPSKKKWSLRKGRSNEHGKGRHQNLQCVYCPVDQVRPLRKIRLRVLQSAQGLAQACLPTPRAFRFALLPSPYVSDLNLPDPLFSFPKDWRDLSRYRIKNRLTCTIQILLSTRPCDLPANMCDLGSLVERQSRSVYVHVFLAVPDKRRIFEF